MPAEITMPQLSDTMTEGTLVSWLKKEGDKVAEGENIAEVETDKATMELESFESGILAFTAVEAGGKVPVGAVVAVLAAEGEDPVQVKKQFQAGNKGASSNAGQAPAATANKEQNAPAGKAVKTTKAKDSKEETPAKPVPTKAAVAEAPAPAASSSNGSQSGERLRASPLARRVAADKNVDLHQVAGTGPGGRIVKQDVLDHQPAATAASATSDKASAVLPQRVASGEKKVIELTKMRSTIAQRLQQSKQQVPHFYETIDIEMDALVALRQRMNDKLEKQKIRLSIADFISKAVAGTLQRVPALNATFDGSSITRYGDVNLGIAVALDDGLIVPVLRGVDQMGLAEIRQRSADLIDRARAQRLKRDEMNGATFTISNLGTSGIREFSAIVNPPEVGILAIGSAEQRAVVRNGQIVARTMMTVTLSADHRAVDGAVAAEFLSTLRSLLEEPAMMLL